MKNVQGFTRMGFTLFELLIALACTVLALGALASLTMRLYQSWQTAAVSTQGSCEMHAAIDVIRNDVQRAPCARSVWKKLDAHELIWQASSLHKALRIALANNRLERCEGSYDERSNVFHTSSSSVLAHGVKQIRCTEYHRTSHTCDAIGVTLVMLDGKEGAWLLSIG